MIMSSHKCSFNVTNISAVVNKLLRVELQRITSGLSNPHHDHMEKKYTTKLVTDRKWLETVSLESINKGFC